MSLTLGAVLAFAALGPAPGADDSTKPAPPQTPPAPAAPASPRETASAEVPFELRPYKIRAWLSIDSRARVDPRGRESMIAGWKVMVGRFVGAPWQLEIAEGEGPLATKDLEEIQPKDVLPLVKGFDKAWMIRVEPDGAGLSFAAREYDATTERIGLLCRREAKVPADAPRALLRLCLDVFAPVAEIGDAMSQEVKLKVQGSMIPSADPLGAVAPVGAMFRPMRIYYKPDGSINRIDIINNTFCRAESIEGGIATCSITTALAEPFTKKIIGRFRAVAIGLKPASIPTRLRFVTVGANKEHIPASGYKLITRPVSGGSPREAGATDREGRIVLEPNYGEGLLLARLLAADIEPLTEFPLMPGIQVEERTIGVDLKSPTVTIESEINAIRDEIVDMIAIRRRLESKIKARIEGENWDEAKQYMDEFRRLPSKADLESRVTRLDESLNSEQSKNRGKAIRTGTYQRLIGDTKALIDSYLNDDEFASFDDAYQRHIVQANADRNATKALPKAPPLKIGGGTSAGGGAITEVAPLGAGFQIVFPGLPGQSTAKAADGASEIKIYRLTDPTKGVFSAEYWTYPIAMTDEERPKAFDGERTRALATVPGSKVVKETPITIDGRDGREIEFEVAGQGGQGANGLLLRTVELNARIYTISFYGPKAWLREKTATDFFGSFHLTARPTGGAPSGGGGESKSEGAAPKGQGGGAQKKAPAPKGAGGRAPF